VGRERGAPVIADSNHACFAKMVTCGLEELFNMTGGQTK
jgi:hypothetical protein